MLNSKLKKKVGRPMTNYRITNEFVSDETFGIEVLDGTYNTIKTSLLSVYC